MKTYTYVLSFFVAPFVYIVWALDACKQAQIDDVKFEAFPVPGLGLPVENQI